MSNTTDNLDLPKPMIQEMNTATGASTEGDEVDCSVCNAFQPKKCYIKHVESAKYLHIDETNQLGLAALRKGITEFDMNRHSFAAMGCKDGALVNVCAFEGTATEQARYVSVHGARPSVAAANLKSLGDGIDHIDHEDPRFFVERRCQLASVFESTKHPKYYLASDGTRVFMRYKESIDARTDADLSELIFDVKYLDDGAAS